MGDVLFFSWHLSLVGPASRILFLLKGHRGRLFDVANSNMKGGLFAILMRAGMPHRYVVSLSARAAAIFSRRGDILVGLLLGQWVGLLVVLEVEELLEEF
jgi:hypothetical protein